MVPTQLGWIVLGGSLSSPDAQVVTFDDEAPEEPEEEDMLAEVAADVCPEDPEEQEKP